MFSVSGLRLVSLLHIILFQGPASFLTSSRKSFLLSVSVKFPALSVSSLGCFLVLRASGLTVEKVDDGDGDSDDGDAANEGNAIIPIIPGEAAVQSVNPGIRLLRLRASSFPS